MRIRVFQVDAPTTANGGLGLSQHEWDSSVLASKAHNLALTQTNRKREHRKKKRGGGIESGRRRASQKSSSPSLFSSASFASTCTREKGRYRPKRDSVSSRSSEESSHARTAIAHRRQRSRERERGRERCGRAPFSETDGRLRKRAAIRLQGFTQAGPARSPVRQL